MEITATRTGEQLVLSLNGRMDGTGAQQVTAAIQQNLTDHDSALIFDLGGVDYLSSAGLRVFQEYARKMKERKGSIAACRVQDFAKKLFASAGFNRILAEYPSVQDALNATARAPGADASSGKTLRGNGWSLVAQPGTGKPGILTVTGNLSAIHAGKIMAADVKEIPAPAGTFFTGIGAMAKDRDAAVPLVGEMVQSQGSVFWIPTDGHANPDFFFPGDLASSGMKSFALFAASFSGPFSGVLRITPDKPEGMSLAEVYAAIFAYLREQSPDFSGVCAVTIKATIDGLCSSDLKDPLLAAAAERANKRPLAMPPGHTATEYPVDASVLESASAVDIKPKYAGEFLISIGYGVDPALAEKKFSRDSLAAIAFKDPRAGTGLFLYNKGIVYKNLKWDNSRPFDEQLKAAPASGEFLALHNLLAITRVKSAVAGILPVAEIRPGP
ncbi:MAG: anti-sigma factor antagonist [Methanomicrobiales archaeon]|nr:anti-sigma factor antagonist [Methanomicrobiales archaeon]